MQRFLSTGVVLGLLVATAVAFAVTESLKLTQSPITRTQVSKVLSPVCGCPTDKATIKFWLRHTDDLTLSIVDSNRNEVKRLVDGVTGHARWNTFQWGGRTDSGSVAPDGTYYARVHLAKAHRTIQLPNEIVLDTKPPKVLDAQPSRPVFSPDGDGQADSVKIRYRLSERAQVLLFLRGKKILGPTRFARPKDSFTWYGKVNGVALPQGTYRLRVGAIDVAGNVTGPLHGKVVVVKIRYIELKRHRIVDILAGTRFGVGVKTDAAAYTWKLGTQTGGESGGGLLILRAPSVPGVYPLVVTQNGHSDKATVVVVPR